MSYWPWWLGAIALATVAVATLIATGRSLGVSGFFATALSPEMWRADRTRGALDMNALQAALAAATAKEFGDTAVVAPSSEATLAPVLAPRLSAASQAIFLLGIALGAGVAALARGHWGSLDMGATFAVFFGRGASMYALLFGGGTLVGLGTRLAGGCTSGHGLVGCARLEWVSILATALFFGTAIAVSVALARVLA